MSMSLNRAKAVAKDPESFSNEELDDALTTIVDSPDLTEAQVTALQSAIDPVLRERIKPKPDWVKSCGRCGETIERYRGMAYVYCGKCGAEHNAGGQLLRDDWRGNPSAWNEDIGDLEGYEIQHADDDRE